MQESKHRQPLYKRLLKENYNKLPQAVYELHDLEGESHYLGKCCVQRGKNLIAKVLASFLSLPRSGEDIAIGLSFRAEEGVEHWVRHFDNQKLYSRQWEKNGFLHERLPGTTLVFTPVASANQLELCLEQVYFLGVPVIWLLRPKVIARERQEDEKFHFYVHVTIPIVGMLITYQGYLKREYGTPTLS
jgi:hypothetical protein